MARLSEVELKRLIKGGETTTVELKLAAPRPVEMAERLCGMANAQGGVVIIGVRDLDQEIVGVQENRLGETLDVILRAARQIIKPELMLDPPEPEMYTIAGKKLVVATVRPSRGPVYQSKLRNQVLAGLLRDLPGYMEQIGSGIRYMLDETKRLGLPPPEFREMNEFVVTFRAAPALQPRQEQAQYQGTLWREEEPLPSLPAESVPGNLEGRLVKAVSYVYEHGFITNKIYRSLTGVSERTARRDLEVLEERGRLKALGKRRARQYVLP
jgi:predicted HTH transcriptional regulator